MTDSDLKSILKGIAQANNEINNILQNRGRYELREIDKVQLRRWKSIKAAEHRALDELTKIINL